MAASPTVRRAVAATVARGAHDPGRHAVRARADAELTRAARQARPRCRHRRQTEQRGRRTARRRVHAAADIRAPRRVQRGPRRQRRHALHDRVADVRRHRVARLDRARLARGARRPDDARDKVGRAAARRVGVKLRLRHHCCGRRRARRRRRGRGGGRHGRGRDVGCRRGRRGDDGGLERVRRLVAVVAGRGHRVHDKLVVGARRQVGHGAGRARRALKKHIGADGQVATAAAHARAKHVVRMRERRAWRPPEGDCVWPNGAAADIKHRCCQLCAHPRAPPDHESTQARSILHARLRTYD